MENNDIKNIWKALADNQLIDKKLARENIMAIVKRRGVGLFSKMKKKILFDYILYLSSLILVPIAILFVNVVLNRPSPVLQIVGIFAIECYLLLMFLKAKRKLKSLSDADNTGTIKESLINFRNDFLRILNRERIVVYLFSYSIMTLAIVQYFIYKGSVFPISFSDYNIFFPIFLLLMMFMLPLIIKLEYKIRFSQIVKDMNNTIDELNREE